MPTLLPAWSSVGAFLPEVVLVATIGVVLLTAMVLPRRGNWVAGLVTAVGLVVALGCLLGMETHQTEGAGLGGMVAGVMTWGGSYFGGMLVMDPFAWMFKVSLLVFVLLVVGLWAFTTREKMGPGDGPEFFTLLLTATLGLSLMGCTTHLLMMFLAIEMASLPSYVLAGFRKTHKPGAEAALKYVLFGAVATALMLYGMSLLYGLTGTLELSRGMAALGSAGALSPEKQVVLVLGLAGLLLGMGFKIALVPAHFWAPDVFEGAGIDVAAFLSVASKAGGLAMLMRVMIAVLGMGGAEGMMEGGRWMGVMVLVLGCVTCTWANLAAYAQNNIKRLLAYSSIAHAGVMLMGVSMVMNKAVAGEAAEVLLFYMFIYSFMNGGAFLAAAAITERIGSEDIRDYAGLGRRLPILAACMAVFVLALVGVPPTGGFGAKLRVFLVMFDAHDWTGYLGVTVLAGNAVVAAFYYFRILRQMYLRGAEGTEGDTVVKPAESGEFYPATALAVVLAVMNVATFVGYSWVNDEAKAYAQVYGGGTEVVRVGVVGK